MARSLFRNLSLIVTVCFLWACTQGGTMLPGSSMDGLDGSGGGAVGDGGGSGAAPTIGDVGADSNDGTTDGCPCGNCVTGCPPDDLAIPDPDPDPDPPGPQFKALAGPGNDPGEEDSEDDEETEYQGIIFENTF